MPIVFRTTPTGIQQSPYSQLIVTPITNLTATSTVAGQIVLTWSGGVGYNVQYSYAVSTGTIQSTSGINPTTITLISTNSVTTTVTLTETVLGGSGTAVSNSVTTPLLLTAAISTTPTVTSGTISSLSSPNFETQGMSISVKYNLTSASSAYNSTFMSSTQGLRLFNYEYNVSNLNVFTFQLNSSASSTGGTPGSLFITPTFNSYSTGAYHLVITIGTGINPPVIIYLNNVAYTFGGANGLKNQAAGVYTSASNFWGGKYNFSGPYTSISLGTSTGSNYPGTTTDLRFFDYPLNSAQVNAIYTNAA